MSVFPTVALRQAYVRGYKTCYEFAKRNDYSSLDAYLSARGSAPSQTVADAERYGCSDANSETPFPGSGMATVPYNQDYP